MQESNTRRSAVIFVVGVIFLAVILLGGVYILKHRDTSEPNKKPETTAPKKTDKESKKESEKSKKNGKDSSKPENSSSGQNAQQPSSSSGEVAAVGPSEFWYAPVLGLVALGLGGYEYYLSRQALKNSLINR